MKTFNAKAQRRNATNRENTQDRPNLRLISALPMLAAGWSAPQEKLAS